VSLPERHPYGTARSQFGELFLPSGGGPWPVAVVLHGGFWRAQYSRRLMRPVCEDLAARGWAAFNVEYRRLGRLSGGGFPRTLEDVAAAVDHLAELPAHRRVGTADQGGGDDPVRPTGGHEPVQPAHRRVGTPGEAGGHGPVQPAAGGDDPLRPAGGHQPVQPAHRRVGASGEAGGHEPVQPAAGGDDPLRPASGDEPVQPAHRRVGAPPGEAGGHEPVQPAIRNDDPARPAGGASRALDLSRVVAIGHSAGGHLAAWLATRERARVPVTAVVAQAGVVDLRLASELGLSRGVVNRFLGGAPATVPERCAAASPAERLPLGVPALLTHGGRDDIVPPVMSERFAAAARAAGDEVELVVAPDEGHFGHVDVANPLWRAVTEWIR
jgi:acetyl esterase/lipase